MKRLIFPVLIFLFLFLPRLVAADTFVSGQISTDTIWSPAGGVYVIDSSFSVASGVTLTIEPGTIIKAKATWYGGPSIHGRMIARGTSELPIYFTSIWDDSVGGDTNGDGPSVGTHGGWQGLYFKEGSVGDFEHVVIRYAGYGGYGFGSCVGIENDGGIVEVRNSNIYDNYIITSNGAGGSTGAGSGIYNKKGSLFVVDSVIDNNVNGIRIDSGSTTISNNIIKNNIDPTEYSSGYGIYVYGPGKLTLLNNTFIGNKRTARIDASQEFIHAGNTSEDLVNKGFEINGNVLDGSVFHSKDLPVIVGYLTVEAGKTLTIEPGTIIKMSNYYSSGNIVVYGNLIAKGTPENKIYITSLRDDSVGGDLNGDGSNTTPAPRDWNAIYLESGKAEFDNVVLRYGGYNYNGEYLPGVAAAIYQRGAEFSVSNSLFEYNRGTAIYQDAGTTIIDNSEIVNGDYGIWSRGGSINISQSSFYDLIGYGVYNESGKDLGWWWQTRPLQIINAKNNWWGSADGPKDTSTSTPTGNGSRVSENVLYTPFLGAWPPVVIEDSTINPVIIIPGIMGSAKKNGEWLIDPILHTYDDLIATLEANGYEKNKNLFTFPYEWRDSNILTANLLKNKIASVIQQCSSANLPDTNCNKVDIVAHSMGGLVAREYIQSGQYQNNVDQLIFLGTPHKGSPTSYLRWEGVEFGESFFDKLTKQLFTLEAYQNGYLSLFNYIHNRPISSAHELLPVFDYIIDKDTEILRSYSNNYPRNIFLESLNTELGISKLINSGVRITNLTGNTGNNTIENIIVFPTSDPKKWEHGEVISLKYGPGDKTVTQSGSYLHTSILNEEWPNVDHQSLPRETSARIFNLLTNETAGDVIYISTVEKIFSIQLQSPIDVVITAPDGKRIGKNFVTGEEYNEIAGAFYSGFNNGDEEYITIPNPIDGEYKIEIQGTGNGGEYGVLTSYITEETSITNQIMGIIKPNQITELNTQIDSQNPEVLETVRIITLVVIKNDIDGAYDLGWIKDKKTRDSLIKQVERAVKSQKRIETIYEKLPNGKKKEKRIEKIELKVNKLLLRLFEKELDLLFKKNKITQEALDLIKLDIKYLLENN